VPSMALERCVALAVLWFLFGTDAASVTVTQPADGSVVSSCGFPVVWTDTVSPKAANADIFLVHLVPDCTEIKSTCWLARFNIGPNGGSVPNTGRHELPPTTDVATGVYRMLVVVDDNFGYSGIFRLNCRDEVPPEDNQKTVLIAVACSLAALVVMAVLCFFVIRRHGHTFGEWYRERFGHPETEWGDDPVPLGDLPRRELESGVPPVPMGGECSLCMDQEVDAWCEPCNHTGCRKCLADVQHRGQACPFCREPITRVVLALPPIGPPPVPPVIGRGTGPPMAPLPHEGKGTYAAYNRHPQVDDAFQGGFVPASPAALVSHQHFSPPAPSQNV